MFDLTRSHVFVSYFPFTEPSAEFDSVVLAKGKGCRICKNSGWINWGSGMVTQCPANRRSGSEEYSGFAFGLGIDRMCALMYELMIYGCCLRMMCGF